MKKLIVLSAVLIGAVTASQAGVLHDIGVGLRVPFLPRVVVRPPPLVYQSPPVVYEAPRQVCLPPRVVYAPAPVVCAPVPLHRGVEPGWRGRPDRDFRPDPRGWDHGRDGHIRR
jgi:hypothetical protein